MAFGFLTNQEAREKISGLETRITELESEVAASSGSLTAAQADLATANETLSEAQADLANARERINELETENARIPGLEAAAEVTKEKVSAEAARQLAASGHPAPIEGIDDKGGEAKTMSHTEFNNLPHNKRNAFIREGGKLS